MSSSTSHLSKDAKHRARLHMWRKCPQRREEGWGRRGEGGGRGIKVEGLVEGPMSGRMVKVYKVRKYNIRHLFTVIK